MLRIKQRFSIKKLSIGVFSVGLAAACYLSPGVHASDESSPTNPIVANETTTDNTTGTTNDDASNLVFTFNHYLIDADGTRVLDKDYEYKSSDLEAPLKHDMIEKNGKTYVLGHADLNYETMTVEAYYNEVKKEDTNTSTESATENTAETTNENKPAKDDASNPTFTYNHYLIDADGTRVLHKEFEYQSNDLEAPLKHTTIEYNSKTYVLGHADLNYETMTVEAYYNEVAEYTMSVDEEGNELARQQGTVNARNGDVEFNGKTYTHVNTVVNEATKTTRHIYARVQTLSKDTDSNLLKEEDGRHDYKTGDVEFNGKYYAYDKTEVNKGTITHYYRLLNNEVFTFNHYLVNSDGTRTLDKESEYQSRDLEGGMRQDLIERNGKTYYLGVANINYETMSVDAEYNERTKVAKHVIKDTTDFTAEGTTTQALDIPATENEPRRGIFEINGKYYKYARELPNVRTFNEPSEEIHYYEYEEVANVTKHETPVGVVEIDEGSAKPIQTEFLRNGKAYKFDKTDVVDGVTIHHYKESVEGSSKYKIVKQDGATEVQRSNVSEDGKTAEKDGETYNFLRKVAENGVDVYYYAQYDATKPVEELKVTRSIDSEGNELEVEIGEKEPRAGIFKVGNKEYIFDRSETIDGITTHYYKAVESSVPSDAPSVEKGALEITRFVTPEGEEVDLQEGVLRVKSGVLTIKGKKYEYISTDEKDGIITHLVKEVKGTAPTQDDQKPQPDNKKPRVNDEKPQQNTEKPQKDAEKSTKSNDAKESDDQVKKLPNTGMTDNTAALSLLTLALAGVIRKRKSE